MSIIKAPSIDENSFNCPFCNAYAAQTWFDMCADRCGYHNETPSLYERSDSGVAKVETSLAYNPGVISLARVENAFASHCHNCGHVSLWVSDKLVFPRKKAPIEPNEDMPDEIKVDYEEARAVFDDSPRASAALLRLCIQKLCIHLGESSGKIDTDIANMVKNGLSKLVQQSLDIVRVIGNESVHPGTIDLNDDRDTAEKLFSIVNLIVMQMITNHRMVNDLYNSLPVNKLRGIEQRDKAVVKK